MVFSPAAILTAQEKKPGFAPPNPPEGAAADLAVTKQAEVQEKLKTREESMERLARLLGATEPQNAAKLRSAFQASRERLLREGMDQVLDFLKDKKWDRAVEDQKAISDGLTELLAILLEKDIDPRELIRHIRKLRDLVKDLDQAQKEETREQLQSEEATAAEAEKKNLADSLAKLDDLIRKQKDIENRARSLHDGIARQSDEAEKGKLNEQMRNLAPGQAKVQAETSALRQSASASAAPGSPGDRPPDSESPASPDAKSSADSKSLSQAESAMGAAAKAMESAEAPPALAKATEARQRLEEARREVKEKLERLQARQNFAEMKKEQDDNLKKTDTIANRMKETPPLIFSPEGGVPGRKSVEQSAGSMGKASGSLATENAGEAGRTQKEAVQKLDEGRQQAEEALEELQKALRERLLAYLKERFGHMLEHQRKISLETRSLDARLRAIRIAGVKSPLDRKDFQRAEDLSRGEAALATVALDVIDLLEEDGTTLALPRLVGAVKKDLENVQNLLAKVETGALTQSIQKDIERSLQEILAALEQAQKSPPPPDPNKGRDSKNGTGPLLPKSAELKMVRSMQARVNQRTTEFDLGRKPEQLTQAEKEQAEILAARQDEIEELLKKIARSMGE